MKKLLKSFFAQEDGAVAVDWLVMSAAVVLLSLTAMSSAQSGVDTVASGLFKSVEN